MKKLVFGFLILVCSFQLFAQEGQTASIKYAVSIEGGYHAGLREAAGMECVVVNGIRIDQQHVFGLGIGIGGMINYGVYCPVFANYRYYFTTSTTFTPHVNVALGGIIFEDSGGLYSTFTTGFTQRKFTLSTGLFIFSGQPSRVYYEYGYRDNYNYRSYRVPWGFMIKVGVAF